MLNAAALVNDVSVLTGIYKHSDMLLPLVPPPGSDEAWRLSNNFSFHVWYLAYHRR